MVSYVSNTLNACVFERRLSGSLKKFVCLLLKISVNDNKIKKIMNSVVKKVPFNYIHPFLEQPLPYDDELLVDLDL